MLLTPQCATPCHALFTIEINIILFCQVHGSPVKVTLSPGTDSNEDSATLVPLDSGVVMLASAGGPAPTSLTATILNLW